MITLTNDVKKLRDTLKGIDIETLSDFKEKFDSIFTELKEEEDKRIKEAEKRKEVLSKIRELLTAEQIGEINADDLEEDDPLLAILDVKPTKNKKSSSVEPKYEFMDESGKRQLWAGRGRMPTALKNQVDAGADLEGFLIKKD